MTGRQFFKMSGSGNDFVFVDAREEPAGVLETEPAIREVCARATGVGADGIVFLERTPAATLGMRYFNADGSVASLCGNATLCATRLAVELDAAAPAGFTIETGSGVVGARIAASGQPEIDLQPVEEVREDAGIEPIDGERRAGFALVGVPHLVVLVDDVERVDVVGRGRPLRRHPSLRQGANVNFVSRDPSAAGGFRVRTYERGVEGETLACGSGAVASAILLTAWGEIEGPVALRTRSGRTLTVRLGRADGQWLASLSGEGRIVFTGHLGELATLEDAADRPLSARQGTVAPVQLG
jgi:diaminopimelate epimerase